MSLLSALARPLLAIPFILEGIDAITRPEPHADLVLEATETMEKKAGTPPLTRADAVLFSRVGGVVSVAAAGALLLGKRPRTAACVLAALNVATAVVRYPFWRAATRGERDEHLAGLARAGAVTGGLLLASADRGGAPSWSWQRANRREQKQALSALRRELREKYTA
ncbi:DoxX family membrane protein [Buchananella felis]|uniref:DoxX family membrane protein n=1 Tax=Buchananella felis TaxID=3231492 RepID=UPI00352895AA